MSDKPDHSTLTGALPAKLANAVSDALHAAMEKGMEPDEACCVAAAVVADYWRTSYGDGRLHTLAEVIEAQQGRPLPGVGQ